MKKTPTYFLEKSDNPDFVHLVFRSGAPYEDIGFKIVNKEWEVPVLSRSDTHRTVLSQEGIPVHL